MITALCDDYALVTNISKNEATGFREILGSSYVEPVVIEDAFTLFPVDGGVMHVFAGQAGGFSKWQKHTFLLIARRSRDFGC